MFDQKSEFEKLRPTQNQIKHDRFLKVNLGLFRKNLKFKKNNLLLFLIKNYITHSGTASKPSLRSRRESSDALLHVEAKIMKLFPVNSFTTDTKYVS